MVRNYVRKTSPPSYTKKQLFDAVAAVQTGSMTLYRASQVYEIPKPTLFKRVKGQRGVKSSTFGRDTCIPHAEEQTIANCLITMERWGFGLSKKELLEAIGRYTVVNNISTPFKNGIPGHDYFRRFKKQFGLSIKKPQSVEVARKRSIDPFTVSEYFRLLKEVTTGVPPSQIYNLDESSFCLDPKKVKVVGAKGTAAHRATSGTGRDNISVLIGASAAGEKLPPFVVFKGKNVWDSWIPKEAEFPNMAYAATKNGWMDAITFDQFFRNNFLAHLPPERPVVVIYDGCSSHVSIPLVEEARKQNITILKLPPHTTHVLQPLDLSTFKPMKDKWDEELVKWQRKNYGVKLPKSVFSSIIAKIWKSLDPQIIQNGFQKGGITPFNNSEVIPVDRYDPTQYRRWCETEGQRQNSAALVTSMTAASSSPHEIVDPIPSTSYASPSELLSLQDEIVVPVPTTSHVLPNDELLSSQNEEVDPVPSTSHFLPANRKMSFEEVLLEYVKQAPRITKKRKKICGGAEIITSEEALVKLHGIETEKRKKKNVGGGKRKIAAQANITKRTGRINNKDAEGSSEESEDGRDFPRSGSDSDEFNFEEELREAEEETQFLDVVSKPVAQAAFNDWVLVKLLLHGNRASNYKMYVGQVTEDVNCLEVKFGRRIGSTSTFHWPSTEDKSIIRGDEIVSFLPPPAFDRRGKFTFPMSFASYNVG